MAELFASGRIIDLILALVVIEGIILAVVHQRWRRGIPLRGVVANLAAGAALMIVVRLALTGAAWPLLALSLFVALLAHIWDLLMRWR